MQLLAASAAADDDDNYDDGDDDDQRCTNMWSPSADPFPFEDIVHYEYMALAPNTSVLLEAMPLFVEPRYQR